MKPLNQFLHEDVMGLRWHGPNIKNHTQSFSCLCGLRHCVESNPSYSDSWQDYGKLLEKVSKDVSEFHSFISDIYIKRCDNETIWGTLFKPKRGSEAIARFMGWEG